ncbi:MAG: hypothetical protein RR287_04990, partial [Oscillospiraceae bacterium]
IGCFFAVLPRILRALIFIRSAPKNVWGKAIYAAHDALVRRCDAFAEPLAFCNLSPKRSPPFRFMAVHTSSQKRSLCCTFALDV